MNFATMRQKRNNSQPLRICKWIYEKIINIKFIIAASLRQRTTPTHASRALPKQQPELGRPVLEMREIEEIHEDSWKTNDIRKKDFSAKGKNQKTIPPSIQGSGNLPAQPGSEKHPQLPVQPASVSQERQDFSAKGDTPKNNAMMKDSAQEKKVNKDANLPQEKSTLPKEPEHLKPKGYVTGRFSRVFTDINARSDEFIESRLEAMRRSYSIEGKKP